MDDLRGVAHVRNWTWWWTGPPWTSGQGAPAGIVNVSVVVATAVNGEGNREIIGIGQMAFLRRVRQRGHSCKSSAPLARCRTHFMTTCSLLGSHHSAHHLPPMRYGSTGRSQVASHSTGLLQLPRWKKICPTTHRSTRRWAHHTVLAEQRMGRWPRQRVFNEALSRPISPAGS